MFCHKIAKGGDCQGIESFLHVGNFVLIYFLAQKTFQIVTYSLLEIQNCCSSIRKVISTSKKVWFVASQVIKWYKKDQYIFLELNALQEKWETMTFFKRQER